MLAQRRISIGLALLVLMASALGAEVVNKIVLRVNDRIATLYEYELRRAERLRAVQHQDLEPSEVQRLLEDAGKDVFRNLFQELLVLSRADQLDIQVSEERIDAAIEQTKKNFGIESEEEFRVALARSGMTERALRSQLRDQIRMQEVLFQEVQSKIQVEDAELQHYYREHPEEFVVPEKVKVSEVVVLESAVPDPAERERLAHQIRGRVESGETFEEVVDDLVAKSLSSNLIAHGWVTEGDLDPALEEAIWSLEAGQFSDPVAARGGVHLLRVEDRQASTVPPFEDVEDEIARRLSGQRYQQGLSDYFEELRESALVRTDPPPEAAGFLAGLGVEPGLDVLQGFGETALPEPGSEGQEAPAEGDSPSPEE